MSELVADVKYVNVLALIPEHFFFLKKGKKCLAKGIIRGENAPQTPAEWGLQHNPLEERAARLDAPCLVPHMAFLPRCEGGEAVMLLNKPSKRADLCHISHNMKSDLFLRRVTTFRSAPLQLCGVSDVYFATQTKKRQLQVNF